MKRHYYAMIADEYSINQSRECRKEWGTVRVKPFESKAQRDAFCTESVYHIPISAADAKYYGIWED